jgi:hypothetical protein
MMAAKTGGNFSIKVPCVSSTRAGSKAFSGIKRKFVARKSARGMSVFAMAGKGRKNKDDSPYSPT